MSPLSESEFSLLQARSRRGDSGASIVLAEHYLEGGFRSDAKKFFLVAAKQGSSVAANAIALLCEEDGENEEAVAWLKLSCQAGNKLACTHLSIAYTGGLMGLMPDKKKAADYARLGDPGDLG